MAGIVGNLRTFDDYRRADEEFQMRKAEQQAKLEALKFKMQNPQLDDNVPSPIKIADEIGKARKAARAGDPEALLRLQDLGVAAKMYDKGFASSLDGGVASLPGYDKLLAERKGLISAADEQAKQIQKTAFEPRREGLKKTEEEMATLAAMEPKKREEKRIETKIAAEETAPLLESLSALNKGTIDAPYAAAFQPFLKVGGSDKATALDLMKQARLELAAPLAKQLGVNPTDKDFQASLDRIFDINATQKSRGAQIEALKTRVKGRANIYSPEENIPTGSNINLPKIDPSKIPMAAVNDLKNNPATAAQFDEIFGDGASKMVLRK